MNTQNSTDKKISDKKTQLCFPGSTLIDLAGGSRKRIDGVQAGEFVACFDFAAGRMSVGEVLEVLTGKVSRLVRLNDMISGSGEQTLVTDRGVLTFDEVEPGDEIFLAPAITAVPVVQKIEMVGEVPVYNLIVYPHGCFFADGVLVEDQQGLPSSVNPVSLHLPNEISELRTA